MTSTEKSNKATAVDVDSMIITGIAKYLANATSVAFLGTSYSAATLTARFQGEIDALNAIDSAKAQLKQQVANAKGSRTSMRALRAALKKYILSAYGTNAVQVLEDFGMKAPKAPGPKTEEAKAKATAKAAATRKARKEALKNALVAAPAANAAASNASSGK